MSAGKRKEGESFTDYKARLKQDEVATKEHLRGQLVYSPRQAAILMGRKKQVPYVRKGD